MRSICAAGEAGLGATDVSSGAATAAAGVGVPVGAAGGPASIAIGEAGYADGDTGAPSAVSWPAGGATVRVPVATGCASASVCAAADSGTWLAGVLVVERADWNSAARGSATGFATGSARKSTAGVAVGTEVVCVAAGDLTSSGDFTVCCTSGLAAAASNCAICGVHGWATALFVAAPVAAASAVLDAAAAVPVGDTVVVARMVGSGSTLEADGGGTAAGRCCTGEVVCSACTGPGSGSGSAWATCARSVGAGSAPVDRGSLRTLARPAVSARPTVAIAAGAAFVTATYAVVMPAPAVSVFMVTACTGAPGAGTSVCGRSAPVDRGSLRIVVRPAMSGAPTVAIATGAASVAAT